MTEHLQPPDLSGGRLDRLRGAVGRFHKERTAAPPPAEPSATPGQAFGHYTLADRIGGGGMGVVWKAWDGRLRRWVALKLMRDGASDENRQRFIREGQATARLRHPNLVTVYDVGETDGRPYLAMELVTGRSIDLKGPKRETLAVIRKVALALDEAHRQGVVHRDLKPSNVMIDERGEPRVVDFGLAMLADSTSRLTETGVAIGTPQYMAPEQFAGGPVQVGPATDIYALGIMLYEAMEGRLPFESDRLPDLVRRILNEDPSPPEGARDLVTICMKAVEKDLSRRYASAGEFGEDLRRFLSGEPIAARPPSLSYRVRKAIHRRRTALLLAAALTLAVATGWLGLGLWSLREESMQRQAVQDRIRPVVAMIQETRPFFYVPGDEILRRLEGMGQALSELEAEARDPRNRDHPELWLTLGMGWYLAGDPAKAEPALLHAAGFPSTRRAANSSLGRFYLERSVLGLHILARESASERRERMRAAEENLRRAGECFVHAADGDAGPDSLDLQLMKAFRMMTQGIRPGDEMETFCRAGIARFSDQLGHEEFRCLLGMTLRGSGRKDEAEEEFTKALIRRPHYAFARSLRSTCLMDRGDWAGAITDLDAAIRLNPRTAAWYGMRGSVHDSVGKFREGEADHSEAIRLNPGISTHWYNRGIAREALANNKGALEDYSEALRLNPGMAEAHVNRGNVRKRGGDRAGAAEDYRKAGLIDPKLAVAFYNLGNLFQEDGAFKEAIERHTQAISVNPRYDEAYVNRGLARVNLQDWKAAQDDFTEAIRINPLRLEAWQNRGNVREARGDFEGAIPDVMQAIELVPAGDPLRSELEQQLKELREKAGPARRPDY